MTKPPAWQVDPAWPAAPASDEDDEAHRDPEPEPQQGDLIAQERRTLRQRVAALHVEAVRLQFKLHHAQRALQAQPAAPTPSPAPLRRRGGRPSERARNDRLLALYHTTAAHLPHLQRCRQAAQMLATEVAASAGLAPERARVMPATTARDAIAEAERHRAALGLPPL
jgi:hypothetical protein